MNVMNLTAFGSILSPWKEATGTLVQSSPASEVEGAIEVLLSTQGKSIKCACLRREGAGARC